MGSLRQQQGVGSAYELTRLVTSREVDRNGKKGKGSGTTTKSLPHQKNRLQGRPKKKKVKIRAAREGRLKRLRR